MQPGSPKPGETCSGSPEAVSDSFINQNGATVTITDINAIWDQGTEVGWLYSATDGKTYVQANYQSQIGINWALSLGAGIGFSVGGSTPGGYSGIKILNNGGQLNSGVPIKCWVNGQQLS